MALKFLVLGCGSIGQRHVKNLLLAGHDVRVWNRSVDRLEAVKAEFGIHGSVDLTSMLNVSYDAIYICTPSSLHAHHAELAIMNGSNVFIEKPVGSSMQDISSLHVKAKQCQKVIAVGSNMRFHPGPMFIKSLVEEKRLGRVVSASMWGGMHLPSWHPNENYLKMYSSLKSLGGGALNDFIHEIDLIHWIFGDVMELTAFVQNSGTLGIETEDMADILFKMHEGYVVSLHIDYLQKPFQRGLRAVCENGWVEWDITKPLIRVFRYSTNDFEYVDNSKKWSHNDMYISQQEHFLYLISQKKKHLKGYEDGVKALEVVEAIKLSDKFGKKIKVDYGI